MKKVLALVLVAMMVLSIAPVSFAATPTYTSYGWSAGQGVGSTVDCGTIKANRDDKVTYTLWLGAEVDGVQSYLTKTDVKNLKLDVKTKYSEGSKVVDDVSLQYKKPAGSNTEYAYIRVRFVEKFVSTGDQDFKFTVYLTYDKKRDTSSEIEFWGTFENNKQDAFEDYDYIYMYDYPVVEAKDYIKATELDLGSGVSIFAKLFEGKKYYGYASQKVKSEDDAVIAKYPAIGSVYYLDTIGLSSSGNYVKLDISDKLYVYNADLEYIGTTADKLSYSTKYYVATEELDVDIAGGDTDEGPSDVDNEPAGTNPDMGGDDVPENVNDNPGTGC